MADFYAMADGRIIGYRQFCAEALHPSRSGQVSPTGVPLSTFTAPVRPDPSPGAGRSAIASVEPTGSGHATPGGVPLSGAPGFDLNNRSAN